MNMVIQWNTIQSQNSISGSHHCGTEGKAATGMPSFHRGSSFSPSSFTSNPAPCLTCLDGPNLWAPAPTRARDPKEDLGSWFWLIAVIWEMNQQDKKMSRSLPLCEILPFQIYKYNLKTKNKHHTADTLHWEWPPRLTIRWQSQLTD